MRKKIILGIVIFVVLAAAIIGVVYFNKNYVVVELKYGDKMAVRTDVTKILYKNSEWDEDVKCTPSLKKLTKLESLSLIAEEDMNLNYLSEMKDLNTLEIIDFDSYNAHNVKFETLPDLPNLKTLYLGDYKAKGHKTNFTLPDDVEYNFDSIEMLSIDGYQTLDFECLKHFKNLKLLHLGTTKKGLTEEQIEELQSRGINVEIV